MVAKCQISFLTVQQIPIQFIRKDSPLKPTIEFDDLGNITKVDDTSFLCNNKIDKL